MNFLITSFLINFLIYCGNVNKKSDFFKLLEKSSKFNQALRKSNFLSIYQLFNPTFRKEISYDSFAKALKEWLKDRKIAAVRTRYINPTSYSAIVSTYIYFEKSKDYYYIATNWLNLKDTWYLVWISKILDHNKFNYGNKNKEEMKKILKKMIEIAFYENKISEIIPKFKKENYLVILKKERELEHNISFPNMRIKWLNLEEIKKYAYRLKLRYYIDFGTIRIFDNFAKGYIDIIPIVYEFQKNSHLRVRGVEMFFKKENNNWQFISFGSRW
ncbi:MAG: hypothetical protein ABIK60_01840 [candidate division WOR-3 bacterium]